MSEQEIDVRGVADALIAATHALDVACALSLFAPDAVIDDPSTGHRFDAHAGIRNTSSGISSAIGAAIAALRTATDNDSDRAISGRS
jgi:ketosteroid isomerase-like protein